MHNAPDPDGSANNNSQSGLAEDALHLDALTGLPDRLSALQYLHYASEQATAKRSALALIAIDIDRFQEVNELAGFPTGDMLLSELGRRLRNIIRKGEIASRTSGDEFLVIVSSEKASKVAARCEEVIQALAPQLHISSSVANVTLSIGVAILSNSETDASELLRMAAIALASAKRDGGSTVRYYDSEVATERRAQIELRHEMEHALTLHQFKAVYQPLFDLRSSRFTGAEALIRWNHPKWGLLAPADFIGVAEESPLISRIDMWMIGHACAQLAAWIRAEVVPNNFAISVNISSREIYDKDFLTKLRECLEQSRLQPENIELEITEAMVMLDFERAVQSLNLLRKFGVGIALDHLGVDQPDLDVIRRFPIDRLKLDRKFTYDLDKDAKTLMFVDLTIRLAKSMNVKVVAQGVETEDQRIFFTEMGFDLIQGYLIGRPLEPEGLERFLRQYAP